VTGSDQAVESGRFGLRYGRISAARSSEDNIRRWCSKTTASR